MNLETRPSLLERLRNPDDQVAWNEFEARYRDLILAYGRSRGLQPCDAEDVYQVVMMSLARALPHFRYDRARGRFRSYLGRAVKHAIERHVNRPSPLSGGTGGERLEAGALLALEVGRDGESDSQWEREWMQHHFRVAMKAVRASVEPRSLEVFDRLLSGRSVEETAREFGTSEQAVHKIKQRVRDRLKDLIADQIAEEDGARG